MHLNRSADDDAIVIMVVSVASTCNHYNNQNYLNKNILILTQRLMNDLRRAF